MINPFVTITFRPYQLADPCEYPWSLQIFSKIKNGVPNV